MQIKDPYFPRCEMLKRCLKDRAKVCRAMVPRREGEHSIQGSKLINNNIVEESALYTLCPPCSPEDPIEQDTVSNHDQP